MTSRTSEILHQVEQAAYDEPETPAGGRLEPDSVTLDYYLSLQKFADDEPLGDFYIDRPVAQPHEVIVESLDELSFAITAVSAAQGGSHSERYINQVVQHESRHGEVAEAIGFTAVYYKVAVVQTATQEPSWQAFCVPFDHDSDITKLELAAYFAAPQNPSRWDMHCVKAMGYKDTEDLTNRVMKHNYLERGRYIPVPLGLDIPCLPYE